MTPPIALGGLGRDLRGQWSDLRQTWQSDALARVWVRRIWAITLAVILLAVAVDITRYLDLHHRKAHFLSLSMDHSLGELVMDSMALATAWLCLRLQRQTRQRTFLAVAVTFVFVALDDALQYHELAGKLLARLLRLEDMAGLEEQDIGELLAWGLAGICLLPVYLWSLRGANRRDIVIGSYFLATFAVLVGFAVGVDLVHAVFKSPALHRVLGWVEDGGENLATCLVLTLAILMARGARAV